MVKDGSGRLNFHSRRMENSSSPPEEKNESPPPPNNQSRLATCPFLENKSGLGSGLTTLDIVFVFICWLWNRGVRKLIHYQGENIATYLIIPN